MARQQSWRICCQKHRKPVSQKCGAALSARRIVSERRAAPRSCRLPETITAQTRGPISTQRSHASSWHRARKLQRRSTERKWEKRCDDGGRRVPPTGKGFKQQNASQTEPYAPCLIRPASTLEESPEHNSRSLPTSSTSTLVCVRHKPAGTC